MSVSRRTTARGSVYDVRLRRPDGTAYKRTFRTKREAEQYEASQRTERAHGTWIDPAGATMCLAEWAQHWLETDAAKTATAKATDRSLLRSAILPTLGHRQLGSITPTEVQRLVASWNTTRKPRSVRRTYSVLAAAFNAAVAADMVARSPCRGVKLPVVEPARARVLSAHDLRRLKDELPIQYRAMVTLGANLGLRFGETAGRRVGRLDLKAGILHVEEAVGEANGVLFTKPPKTSAARRSLPLTAAVIDELRLHLLRQGLQGEPDPFVFQAPAGGPLRRGLFRARVWAPACRRAGLEGLGFHDLRRTNATMLMAAGASIRDAQELLGHKDPRMLLGVYAKSTSEGKRAAVDRLTAALEPADEPPQPPADGGGCPLLKGRN